MTIAPSKEILVFGGGAIGAIFSSLLTRCPEVRLTVLCRSNFDAVQRNGYTVTTTSVGKHCFRPSQVVQSLDDVAKKSYDYIICANKVNTADGACWLPQLDKIVRSHTALVSAQNGIQSAALLHQRYPYNPAMAAISYISCRETNPGTVKEFARIGSHVFNIGLITQTPATQVARDFLIRSATPAEIGWIDDVPRAIWNKAIFNAAFNAATALLGKKTHETLQQPHGRKLVEHLARETTSVAIASGATVHPDMPNIIIKQALSIPSISTSMLEDWRKGKLVEAEPLYGRVVSLADHLGVDVPVLKAVYSRLRLDQCAGRFS